MPNVNCNLCGADDFDVVFEKGVAQTHRIVRCKRCSLMYANPQELVDCENFDEAEDFPDADTRGFQQYARKQQVQIPDNLRALAVLNKLAPNKGRLLEIGCYMGIFADRIRASGWDITCLEPYAAAGNYARKTYGLNVIKGLLPQPKLPDATFDAAMLVHVIEHMPDPGSNLAEIRRLLKTGGHLVVETPRFDSLMFKILGRRERSLGICHGHIYFFEVPTLTRLLEKHGFKVVRTDLVGRTLTLDRFLANIGTISKSPKFFGFLNKISDKFKLERFVFHVNVRDMQRLYCRAI